MRLITSCTIGVAALGAASACPAMIIQGTELPPLMPVTTQLGVGYGATFSSLNNPEVVFTELIPGTYGVQGTEPWALPSNGGEWLLLFPVTGSRYVNFRTEAQRLSVFLIVGFFACWIIWFWINYFDYLNFHTRLVNKASKNLIFRSILFLTQFFQVHVGIELIIP